MSSDIVKNNISHASDGLHWDRTFNDSQEMKSTFEPINTITDGYWLERTGPLQMRLTIDVRKLMRRRESTRQRLWLRYCER